MARDSYKTKIKSNNKSKQAASSVHSDTNDSCSSSSHASLSPVVAYTDSIAHHQIGYDQHMGVHAQGSIQISVLFAPTSNHPWNSYDNVSPTPAPAFPDDPQIETQDYDGQPDSVYNYQETVSGTLQRTGSGGLEASPRPLTPMGALATPPNGYEWYISPTYQAYLVPLAGTSSTPVLIDSISTGSSKAHAPYGLPTPPPEAYIGHVHYRANSGRRGLPEWVAANPGLDLVDVLDERDHAWTRGEASQH